MTMAFNANLQSTRSLLPGDFFSCPGHFISVSRFVIATSCITLFLPSAPALHMDPSGKSHFRVGLIVGPSTGPRSVVYVALYAVLTTSQARVVVRCCSYPRKDHPGI